MERIVVGVDGSDPAAAALTWVVRLARATGARVEAVTAAAEMPLAGPFAEWDMGEDAIELALEAQRHTMQAVEHEDLEVDTFIQQGQPSAVLLGAAKDADVLVIGTHGHGAIESVMLGSTSRQVAAHAACPTVLVHEDPGKLERIVVGVDGSEEALHALRWAVEVARATGASVEVVTAYHYTPVGIGSPWVAPVPVVTQQDMRSAASDVLDRAVERADATDVVVERTVAEGGAAQRLKDRAEDADLLVVGNRGHGGFAGLLLGSVSRKCLVHPTAPVAVIPSH